MSVTRFSRAILGLAILSFGATACDDDPNDEDTPVATAVTLSSGDQQTGTVSTALTSPIVVKVVDQNGDGFMGATVTWAVASGGGSLDQATTTTGADGTSQVTWTVGPLPGPNTVTATVSGLTPVTFTATGQ